MSGGYNIVATILNEGYHVVQNFCGCLILRMGDFWVLRELIFAIGRNCFFLLGINFCDFPEVTL